MSERQPVLFVRETRSILLLVRLLAEIVQKADILNQDQSTVRFVSHMNSYFCKIVMSLVDCVLPELFVKMV